MNEINEFATLMLEFLSFDARLAGSNIFLLINPQSAVLARKLPKTIKMLRNKLHSNNSSIRYSFLSSEVLVTRRREDMINTTINLLANNYKNKSVQNYIFSFGGDGTHLAIIEAFMSFSKQVTQESLANFFLTKLPCGTGNDGSHTHSMRSFLDEYTNFTTSEIYLTEIKIGDNILYSHNVVSIGLDALIVHYTNNSRLKFLGPLMYQYYNIKALFTFDKLYGNNKINVEFVTENKLCNLVGAFAIIVFSESGHKRYGGGYKVLPDENNFLLANNCNLLKKIMLSKALKIGAHRYAHDSCFFYQTDQVKITAQAPVILQDDGEDYKIPAGTAIQFKKIKSGFNAYGPQLN